MTCESARHVCETTLRVQTLCLVIVAAAVDLGRRMRGTMNGRMTSLVIDCCGTRICCLCRCSWVQHVNLFFNSAYSVHEVGHRDVDPISLVNIAVCICSPRVLCNTMHSTLKVRCHLDTFSAVRDIHRLYRSAGRYRLTPLSVKYPNVPSICCSHFGFCLSQRLLLYISDSGIKAMQSRLGVRYTCTDRFDTVIQ